MYHQGRKAVSYSHPHFLTLRCHQIYSTRGHIPVYSTLLAVFVFHYIILINGFQRRPYFIFRENLQSNLLLPKTGFTKFCSRTVLSLKLLVLLPKYIHKLKNKRTSCPKPEARRNQCPQSWSLIIHFRCSDLQLSKL